MHILIALFALVALSHSPAEAASAKIDLDEKELARSIELDGMVFPVIENRQLKNYLFVSARIRVVSGVDAWQYRAKAHLIRDAIIIATHQEQIHVTGNINKLDLKRAEKICLRAANEALGEEDVLIEMIVTDVASKNGS